MKTLSRSASGGLRAGLRDRRPEHSPARTPHRGPRAPFLRRIVRALASLCAIFPASDVFAWGDPHTAITRAATEVLPEDPKATWSSELQRLAAEHCTIPDRVYNDPEAARFAAMDTRAGQRYIVGLHLPASQPENLEILRTFLGRAVASLADGRTGDAARWAGTLVHALEDWSCPAHSVPDDNMFTRFKQFLPPPPEYRFVPLHGPVEKGSFAVDIRGYEPRVLGLTVDEAAFHLLHRANLGILAARAQVIPILTALYAHDTNALVAAQRSAAETGARLAADALHTIACLATGRIPPGAADGLRTVDLSPRIPLESVALAVPQTSFFSRPYWGHATPGAALQGGTNEVPLTLRIDDGAVSAVRTFSAGIGAGTKCSMTFPVPPGVYRSFEAWAGLHAALGTNGSVVFEVIGDGRSLARVGPVAGTNTARRLVVEIGGVTNLQLVTTSGGGDGYGNYAVWGEPRLVK